MGHLISRAFRRLTQNSSQSSTRSQQAQQQAGQNEQEDTQDSYHHTTGRPVTESIPVGQSIDSAEYAALKNNNKGDRTSQDDAAAIEKQTITSEDPNKNSGVEEAVIKIQALVRGHLTRKALKDSQYHSIPSPNALGQNQFDEESLIKSPLSSIFLTLSPLSLDGDTNQQEENENKNKKKKQLNATHIGEQTPSVTPLDSLAESAETVTIIAAEKTATAAGIQLVQEQRINEDRKKLAKLNTRSATSPSKLETPPAHHSRSPDSREPSSSPAPSEANASIDLNTCDTPASASIDISDHNVKPSDRIASVLHLEGAENHLTGLNEQFSRVLEVPTDVHGEREEEEQQQQQQQTKREPHQSLETPDSLLDNDEEEAAAIRIQSAFRGYRTRKNSPYRTRSPSTLSANQRQEAQFKQQEATIHDEGEEPKLADRADATAIEEDLKEENERSVEGQCMSEASQSRRSSRARQRDCDEQQKLASLDEFTITDEADTTTVKETLPVQAQQQQNSIRLNDNSESPEESVKKSLLTSKASRTDYNNNNNNTDRDQTTTTSLSLDGADLTDVNVSELDTTEAAVSSTGIEGQISIGNVDEVRLLDPRSSFAGKSEASLETLDTDSSFLGAALSINENEDDEDKGEGEDEDEDEDLTGAQATNRTTSSADQIDHPIDEDKSLDSNLMIKEELEAEARKLVNDMTTRDLTGESSTDQGGALVEEAADSDEERALEEGVSDDQQLKQDEDVGKTSALSEAKNKGDQKVLASPVTLSEEEQRAIELESDEIERRDPRGQVSEERVKSPQIITEQPQFGRSALEEQKDSLGDELVIATASLKQQEVCPTVVDNTDTTSDKHEPGSIENGSNSNNNKLTVESPLQQQQKSEGRDSANVSGRSSPAFNSSSAPSSSEGDDDDDEEGEADEQRNQQQQATLSQSPTKRQQQQQQSGGTGTTSKNKKRNNRNKRKSKK